ncbi:kinase-like domain-containing protein [Chaetomidium leptoderma]|uniref:Kinase-like domain-containing protein n=1 Tax=Chaetomidium leptoderma TaxID=669021 RepID=A0AAN6ZTK0_9PEZI|nr:kinase-like domain-containing protein [Chaetomidium leptoderma]
MEDPDLIARLYPVGEEQRRDASKYATNTIRSSTRSKPAAEQRPPETHLARDAREATEPRESESGSSEELRYLPYIELRFSDGPRTSAGFVFGKDPDTSDILLPNIAGISRQHFALTFKTDFRDRHYRLAVRDLGSTEGTIVTYDDQGNRARSKFDWVIAGFDFPEKTETLVVRPHKVFSFRIVVAHHNLASTAYITNVERFLQGAANSDVLFGALRLQSGPQTKRNTASHTPSHSPLLINRGRIAEGKFGVVSRHWNVSTGDEYACKRPIMAQYREHRWKKEMEIMKSVQHDNIVRLCYWTTSPEPSLYMEYMEFGNLSDEQSRYPFSVAECSDILRQSLSALVYLHGRREPIAHRDLKPENILVNDRDPLHIKLADFGLAKAGSLKTHCGTWIYAAPEIQVDARTDRHTVAVDLWSLAVVILQLAYKLPDPGYGSGIEWCEDIVGEASSWQSDGLIDILQHMLVIEATARGSAATCLDAVEAWTQAGAATTPTQAHYDEPAFWQHQV